MRRFTTLFFAALVLGTGAGCAGSNGPVEIRVTASENGFQPESLTVAKGRPTTLIITRTSDATCATEAIFTETGRRYELPLNQEVRIDVPTDAPMTLHYACGMAMYKGRVFVK